MLSLGRLCVTWAYLDRLLNDGIRAYLGCTPAQAAIIGTEADGVASRCKILCNLAYESSPSSDWCDEYVKILRDIQGNLSPMRNRYVHDHWKLTAGTLEKLDRRVSTKKGQSFQPPTLVFDTSQAVGIEDVDTLSVKVSGAAVYLRIANLDISRWKRGETPPRLTLLFVKRHMLHDPGHPQSQG